MHRFPRSLKGILCLVLSLVSFIWFSNQSRTNLVTNLMFWPFQSYGCWQTKAAAAHTLADRQITESDIDDARWTVKATPDGPDLHLNGTVQQIYPQLLTINPNYNIDWNISIPTIRDELDADKIAAEIATELDLVRSKAHNHKRTWPQGFHDGDDAGWLAFWRDTLLNIQCTKNPAKKKAILEGGLYLQQVRGRARLDPFLQKSCSRVSCSDKSGIIWCVHVSKTLCGFFPFSVFGPFPPLLHASKLCYPEKAFTNTKGFFLPSGSRGGEPRYVKGFKPIELDSYDEIAKAAMALFGDCGRGKYISGRVFTRNNWYVVVEKQNC